MLNLNRSLCLVTVFVSSLSFAMAAETEKFSGLENLDNSYYITGGIGDESRIELEAVKSDYNLIITNAYASGSYIGEADIAIYNEAGERILDTKCGPLFYVNLPKGKYVIEVTFENDTKKMNVIVTKAHRNIRFIW